VRRLIHLDTDIGGDPDDLCALVMLLGWPDVEITGVTTVAESEGLRAGFARCALGLAGRNDIPVATGASGSLAGFPVQPGSGDPARYWPEPIVPQPGPPGAALDLLAESIGNGATVVAIGPFTNLALLETMHPGILASASIVVMGGYVAAPPAGLPAWGAEMDWNVQCDTLAARIVFERADPLVVPLDVTLRVTLREAHLPSLRVSGSLGHLMARQGELHAAEWESHGLRRYPGLPSDLLNFHHDPLACAVAAGWDGITVEEMSLSPVFQDRWLSLAADPAGRPIRVARQVDSERFARDWLHAVERADRLSSR
jgi:purine nucleosidase